SGAFGSLQTSVSLCDQAHLQHRAARADHAGIGVIAKRPLAGAVWRFTERPSDFAEGQYWDRFQAMGLQNQEDWADTALRFVAFHTGAASTIVGTARPAHLRRNLDAIARGSLPAELAVSLRTTFVRHGGSWRGLI
ncbi:MAG: hypothetical protein JF617_14105, partial [Burkholderiales bacterium]|nr:hypothetical protein [Burkholderiales bacterium]